MDDNMKVIDASASETEVDSAKLPYVAPESEVIDVRFSRCILSVSAEDVKWDQEEYDVD